ncbi:MAG: hypothetical protein M0011_07680 [Elusimicrobia bacterium]|nr:hypothetical protein [Elusimicrobiota bacterium]
MPWRRKRNFRSAPGIVLLLLAAAVAAGVLACVSVEGGRQVLGLADSRRAQPFSR